MSDNQTIEKVDFSKQELNEEYYNCVFISCDFSKKEFRNTDFDTCEFRSCNFSLCKFRGNLRDVKFSGCKMTGADFAELNRFSNSLVFERSQLDYATFAAAKVKHLVFRSCNLGESGFDNADIAYAVFDDCDLSRVSFSGANLEKADFSTAYNFSIDPASCRLKRTIFSESGLKGLVAHLNIEIR